MNAIETIDDKSQNINFLIDKFKESLIMNFNENIKFIKTHEFENRVFEKLFEWINPFQYVINKINKITVEGSIQNVSIYIEFDAIKKTPNYFDLLNNEYLEIEESDKMKLKLEKLREINPDLAKKIDEI